MGKKKVVVRNFNWRKMGSCSKGGEGPSKANASDSKVKHKPKAKQNLGKEKRKRIHQVVEDEYDDDLSGSSVKHSQALGNESQNSSSSESVGEILRQYLKHKAKKRKLCRGKGESRTTMAHKTEGHKGSVRGQVCRKQFDNASKSPNIVCRVESFCDDIQHFDDDRKQLVRRMGFGSLLDLELRSIPRHFCYWLMTRVQADGTVVFGRSEVLPLGPNKVYSILGLPMGSKPVPTDVEVECVEETEKVNKIIDCFGDSRKETIPLSVAAKKVCPLDSSKKPIKLESEEDEEEFMTAFLILALGKLICTTTNGSNLAWSLVPALTVAAEACEYDWCEFTINWVKDTAERFQSRFNKGGRAGCGGSLLFLLIFYLDHLDRIPVQWGVYPRIKVWNTEAVKAAVSEDRLSKNEEIYGRHLPIDLAYGEDHPLLPRDAKLDGTQVGGQTNIVVGDVVEQVLLQLTPKLVSLVEGIVGKAVGNLGNGGSSQVTTVGGQGFHTVNQTGNSGSDRNPTFQKEISNEGGGAISMMCDEDNPKGVDLGNAGQSNDVFNAVGTVEDQEDPNLCVKQSSFDKRVLSFVRGWKDSRDEKDPGPSIIECDGMDATQRDCYKLVAGRARLGDQYVRMAAAMYTKAWSALGFFHQNKRIVLDPNYAMRVMLKEKNHEELGKKYGKAFLSFNLIQVRVVFVPVLEVNEDGEHWWSLAIDLKGRMVWAIDSLYKKPFDVHSELIDELIRALDVLVQLSDPQWEVGKMCTWERSVFEVQQTDTFSCGILMLACIKHCARSFDTPFAVEKLPNLRLNLFLHDLNNEMNNLKDKLEGILPKDRRCMRKNTSDTTSHG